MELKINQSFQVSYDFNVHFGRNTFEITNPCLRDVFKLDNIRSAKVLVIIDENVFKAYSSLPSQLKAYGLAHQIELAGEPLIVPGGEQVKNNKTILGDIYKRVADDKIDRHSYILAIGGGAVLDMVGYAAATAHRGIRLIRMPSTVLAQNDAGIGVKNSVNFVDRKNFLGTFAPPYAVINDFDLLETLTPVDKRAGMAEAVKVALIKDSSFFDELYENRFKLAQFEPAAVESMIYHCAKLHMQHIGKGGDPFELGSARPLDFGHWSAHKLEFLANYQIRHGEAVAIGIALDSLYSYEQGLLSKQAYQKIWQLLIDLGFELGNGVLKLLDVSSALEEFREHLGGLLCITLLADVGKGVEVNHIDSALMQTCVNELINLAPVVSKQLPR